MEEKESCTAKVDRERGAVTRARLSVWQLPREDAAGSASCERVQHVWLSTKNLGLVLPLSRVHRSLVVSTSQSILLPLNTTAQDLPSQCEPAPATAKPRSHATMLVSFPRCSRLSVNLSASFISPLPCARSRSHLSIRVPANEDAKKQKPPRNHFFLVAQTCVVHDVGFTKVNGHS